MLLGYNRRRQGSLAKWQSWHAPTRFGRSREGAMLVSRPMYGSPVCTRKPCNESKVTQWRTERGAKCGRSQALRLTAVEPACMQLPRG